MADIVYGTEKIRVVIWFEMRLEELMSIHRHLIFIGIQNTDPAVFIQSLDALKQCMRCQFIVMICKSDVIPRCDLDSCIGILRDLKLLVMRNYFDTFIRCCKLLKESCDR